MRTLVPTLQMPTGASRSLAGLAIALTVFAQPAAAAVLFEQVGPGGNDRSSSTLNFLGGSPGFRTADNFQLGSSASVSAIDWVGDRQSGGESFTFTFYADNGGLPGSVLFETTGTLATSPVGDLAARTQYSSVLADSFSAAAGTTYWLSIFNAAADASWGWTGANLGTGLSVQRSNTESSWPFQNAWDMNFRLNSDAVAPVPEPSSWALFAIGMAGVAGMARRSRVVSQRMV